MVGEAGSGKTTQHGSSFTVLKIVADQLSEYLNLLFIQIFPTPKAKSWHALNLVVLQPCLLRNVWPKKWMVCP
jgi:hypothetical protein